jgi:hypothetical protein
LAKRVVKRCPPPGKCDRFSIDVHAKTNEMESSVCLKFLLVYVQGFSNFLLSTQLLFYYQ